MQFDDLISSLKFLNRRQLLCFCLTNRATLNIVDNHFAEWPAIYCEFSIVYKDNNEETEAEKRINKDDLCHSPTSEFHMELNALNCDCEQLLSININNLCTYKLVLNCDCEEKLFLEKFGGGENEEYFELEKYANCKDDWHLMKDPISEIPKFRQYDYRVARLMRQHAHEKKCCQIFAHQIHNHHSCKLIAREFIFEHRRKQQINEKEEFHCPMAVLIRSTNFSKLIAHLKMNFVKIYKFRLQQQQTDDLFIENNNGDDGNKEEGQNFEETFSKICQWILENEKITNATSCIVDVNLMEELLQNLIGNDKINKQQILFDSIGKCGHLQLLFNNYKESRKWENLLLLSKMPEMLLKNPLMITFDCTIPIKHFKTIKNLLQTYNPQHDHRRLLIIEQQKNFNIAEKLINKFFNSKAPNTYFLLIHDHITKNKKFEQKYFNGMTNEYLRIMPAYSYSITNRKDLVPVYFARYSKLSSIADREFEAFFNLLGQNVAIRMQLCEKEMERQNMNTNYLRSWITIMDNVDNLLASSDGDDVLICSFSAFLTRVFPSLNIDGIKKKNEGRNDDNELYNADSIMNFRIKLLPP